MPYRYSFRIKELEGNIADCAICGQIPNGVLTDKMTGTEYWCCNTCFNVRKSQRCKKTSLHIDFQKSYKKDTIPCVKKQIGEVKI